MAISSASGFEIGSSDPIDSRFVLTRAQMLSINENVFPSVYMCVCPDDGGLYIYKKTNESSLVTGKFRKVGSFSDFPTTDTVNKLNNIIVQQDGSWKQSTLENAIKSAVASNINDDTGLPVSDILLKALLGAVNGIASLDANGKLLSSQLPTSAREIVGYMDASADHNLPDTEDYESGNEIIITTKGYIIQSTAFTLPAGNILTNLEVNQVSQLITYGYVFTLEGFGIVESFETDKVTLQDGTVINLPYENDLSAASVPASVQVQVNEGDSMMLIDNHWIHLSSSNGVVSVNGKTGAVTIQEYDAENKEQLAKIGENAEGNLTYNGEEIKGGSDEFTGTKAEWEALSAEEKAKYDGKKVNLTDYNGSNFKMEYDKSSQTLNITIVG